MEDVFLLRNALPAGGGYGALKLPVDLISYLRFVHSVFKFAPYVSACLEVHHADGRALRRVRSGYQFQRPIGTRNEDRQCIG